MPAGALATLPPPLPVAVTVSVCGPGAMNVAVAARACVIGTTQAPVPVQDPLQPRNVEPPVGVAVSVIVGFDA